MCGEEPDMEMTVAFPGGSRVDAAYGEFVIRTDQPVQTGGGGTAPAPFDYFIASLGTCAGLYVLNFLRLRDLPVDDARLTVRTVKDPDGKRLSSITIRVDMPETFPEKYRKAILNAVNLCNVKRLLTDPPRIETIVEIGGQVVAADHTA
jgi:ribosomal protein S12 methylthiotransferase accessory factor